MNKWLFGSYLENVVCSWIWTSGWEGSYVRGKCIFTGISLENSRSWVTVKLCIFIRISMSCEFRNCLRYFRWIPCRIYVRVNVGTILQAKVSCRQGKCKSRGIGASALHHSTGCTGQKLPSTIILTITKYNFTFHQILVQRIIVASPAFLQ